MSTSSSDAGVRAERLVTLTVGRSLGAALLALLLASVGHDLVDPAGRALLLTVAAVHLGVQAAVLLASFRRPTSGVTRVVGEVALVVDLAALGVLLVVTGGTSGPLTPLLLVEVVAVTLLFGRWAGIRASLLATIVVAWILAADPPSVALAIEAVAGADPALAAALEPTFRAALLVAVLWVTALSTGWLTEVTERGLRRHSDDLAMLREITPELDPRQGPDRVAQALAELLVVRLGHVAGAVWLPDGDGLRFVAAHGVRVHPSIEPGERRLTIDEPLIAETIAGSEVRPIRRDDVHPPVLLELFGRRAPLALVPLRTEDGLVGLMAIEVATRFSRGRGRATVRVREVRLLRMVADQASLLLDNARVQSDLADLAVTDAVTGLPNHRFLQQRVAEELERVSRAADQGDLRPLSFALFDLDHFKAVNDTFGHPTGDRVLAAVAAAAQHTLRGTDVVCRYGGEEFALVLVDTDADQSRRACERVRTAISELTLVSIDGRRLPPVTASFGIATVVGGTPERADFIARADAALYAAKEGGRDRVVHEDDRDGIHAVG